jgi:hypothetical protein
MPLEGREKLAMKYFRLYCRLFDIGAFLLLEDPDGNIFFNKVGKLSFIPRGTHQVVVYPMIISYAWLFHQ